MEDGFSYTLIHKNAWKEMNVTREMIWDYLSVIIAARIGECPDEGQIDFNYYV